MEIKIKTRTLTKQGQRGFVLKLPPEWVNDLGIQKDEKLVLHEKDNKLIIERASNCEAVKISLLYGLYPLQIYQEKYPQVNIPSEWVRRKKIKLNDDIDIYRDEDDRLILVVKKEASVGAKE